MDKSFYYLLDRQVMFDVFAALNGLQIPFEVEQINDATAVVFPNLPVRQYTVIRELFGGDGLRYPD